MIQLITISDFTQYKAISSNLNAIKKLDSFILEAQQFDLKHLLGSAFYLDIEKEFSSSPPFPTYSDLFNGSEFTCGNKAYKHEGLKAVLCYLSYARYVLNSNIEATAFGTVHKKTEESEHVDEKTIKRLHDQSYAGAMMYWEDVKKYLNDQDFELWNKCNVKKVNTFRIAGISSDSNKERRYRGNRY